MLDPSRLPSGLVVHQVWSPIDERDDRRPVAHVGDRRREVAGAAMIGAGFVLAVAGVLTGLGFWLPFAGLLMALAGVAYGTGGRAGFYEVAEDGGLGDYLGRTKPDLREMRARC